VKTGLNGGDADRDPHGGKVVVVSSAVHGVSVKPGAGARIVSVGHGARADLGDHCGRSAGGRVGISGANCA